MDLFGDLPDPGTNDTCTSTSTEKGKVENGKTKESLFDDLPQTTMGGSEEQLKSDGNFPPAEKRKSLDELAGTPAPKKLADGLHTLKGYYAERQGERDDMQDAHTIIDDLAIQISNIDESIKRLAFYGVFDGHGGSKASKYAASQIHNNLIQRFPKGNVKQVEKEMKKCFVESYKRTDEDFLRQARSVKPSWKDGSTAVTILAVNDTLFIANLGDSKAVLCRYNDNIKKCTAIPLSKDHSPTQYEERIRIQKAGGQVREGRVMGQLEVSRSIGDGPYKNHGVSCVPDVKRCQLMDNDRYVLIACDGLWKRFDNESAIEYINKILEDTTHEETDFKTLEDVKYESACTQLANEAVRRLSADNVTVVLVAIGTNQPS